VSKGVVAYATAKAAVVQMTKALSLELAFKGVRVNAIAPGWFVTDLNRDFLTSEAGDKLKREIPESALVLPSHGLPFHGLHRRIDQLAGDRIAREGLILVPEGRQVFPDLSVIDNLRLGAYARGSAGEARRIEALLERFAALKARRHQRAGLLSGGEQQMLAIARGLMARPEVLMLDEPSLGLAPKLLEVLYDLLAELRGEGTTILLVDQMATLALSVADRAYVLQSGTIKHSGSAREVAGDPALMRAYLGDHGTAR